MDQSELTHYGILGMHWGRRKGVTKAPKVKKPKVDHTKTYTKQKEESDIRVYGRSTVAASKILMRRGINRQRSLALSKIAIIMTKRLAKLALTVAVANPAINKYGRPSGVPRGKAVALKMLQAPFYDRPENFVYTKNYKVTDA